MTSVIGSLPAVDGTELSHQSNSTHRVMRGAARRVNTETGIDR